MPSPARKSAVRAAAIRGGWRSGLEEKNDNLLASHGITGVFESEIIRYTKPERQCKYTPDFPFHTKGTGKKIYVETKGQFKVADRQNHILIKKQRPELDIRFVFSNPNQRISKQSKTTYAMWCEKNGFQFAKGEIPEEWIYE